MNQQDRELLFKQCSSPEEVRAWVWYFLDIDLPYCQVDADSNSNPLDMVWTLYNHFLQDMPEQDQYLFYSCRDGGKTLCETIFETMVMLHFDASITHLAAIEEQSGNAQKYLKKFFGLPKLRGLVNSDSKRETSVVFYRPQNGLNLLESEFKELDPEEQLVYEKVEVRTVVVVATMASVNGKHTPVLTLDELDVMQNPTVFKESKNIPTVTRSKDGKVRLPVTCMTSTRKTAFGLVQDEINKADKTGLVIRHWNLIDVTEACLPDRHRPDLPPVTLYWTNDNDINHMTEEKFSTLTAKQKEKYQKADGVYAGCAKCKLFPVCKTRLATNQKSTSKWLKPIQHTILTFKKNDLDMAQAQLMCWKPSSKGLVYSRLDKMKHVLSPYDVVKILTGEEPQQKKHEITKSDLITLARGHEVQWYAGIDWGHSHRFVFVNGFKFGPKFFVTHCISAPGLDPEEMIRESETLREFAPVVYPDTADPKMIALFKKHGFDMRKWSKGPVVEGISAVKFKLNPTMGEPELFFVVDVDPDPGIENAIVNISQYSWKLDAAGEPTRTPNDTNDDEADALRYLVVNVFPTKNSSVTTTVDAVTARVEAPSQDGYNQPYTYTAQNYVQKIIEQNTGGYYSSSDPEPEDNKKNEKASRIIFDG
jgi:hypothetical protein